MTEFILQKSIVRALRDIRSSCAGRVNWMVMSGFVNIKSPKQGILSNILGYEAGQPDIVVFIGHKDICQAIALEIKDTDGRQSLTQKNWEGRFNRIHGKYYIVKSLEDALNAIKANGGYVP